MNNQSSPMALASGYTLHWYRIDHVLGQGAFGITYLAHDMNLDRQVAIKEFIPGQFSVRNNDMTVQAVTSKEDFDWGLNRFITEARTLTRFEHPNLVRVLNVFEMNNTAYMVMNYELGKSLQQILKNRKTLSETELINILTPLMGGLEVMHAKGFIHRDIKPGNIFIRTDGSPVLLDFGSARQTRVTAGRDGNEEAQSLTSLVSPGYAPIEQYGTKGDRQGPWTDIYGLGATLYRALAGVMPVAAVDRGEGIVHDQKDPYLPLSGKLQGRYSKKLLAAVDHALAFKAQDRPQSISDWRREFDFSGAAPAAMTASATITDSEADTLKPDAHEEKTQKLAGKEESNDKTVKIPPSGKSSRLSIPYKIVIAGAAFGLVGISIILFRGKDEDQTPAPEPQLAEQVKETTVEPETPAEITSSETAVSETAGDETTQNRIQELLAGAQEDMTALRLTSPKDNNAFAKYLAVLQLDENNEEAKAGFQAISDKYVAMAYRAMDAGKLDKAASYLNKAAAITPDSQALTTAQEDLRAKSIEQESATATETGTGEETPQQAAATETAGNNEADTGFWEKVKKWNAEQEEKAKHMKIEESETDKQVKKGFGVQ